jgi:hypothetical protein
MDPFLAFAAFPTHHLTSDTCLALADPDVASAERRVAELSQLEMVRFARYVLPTPAEIRQVLDIAASGPATASELVRSIDPQRRPFVMRGLAWLAKLGVLKTSLS